MRPLLIDVLPLVPLPMVLRAAIGGLHRVALGGGARVEHLEEPGVQVGLVPGAQVVQGGLQQGQAELQGRPGKEETLT